MASKVDGIVRDAEGDAITGVSVDVAVYDRSTYAFLGSTTSASGTGVWSCSLTAAVSTKVVVLFFYEGTYDGDTDIAGAEFMTTEADALEDSVFEFEGAAGVDDGFYYYHSTGPSETVYQTTDEIMLKHQDDGIHCFTYPYFRFSSINIANASTIQQAHLVLSNSTVFTSVTGYICVEDIDNAGAVTTNTATFLSRYAARSSFSESESISYADLDSREYDVTDLVQLIVNRAGWASGNSILFMLYAQTSVEGSYWSYERNAVDNPRLKIWL